jgi:hypothetical protein
VRAASKSSRSPGPDASAKLPFPARRDETRCDRRCGLRPVSVWVEALANDVR